MTRRRTDLLVPRAVPAAEAACHAAPATASADISAPPALCVDRAGLAALLDVSPRQVSRLYDSGMLPEPLELGGCKRWPIEEIEAWVHAGAPPRRQWQNLRSALAAPRLHEAGLG
jgi:predicted DNA-binding transcriptional regulator AlpA